MSPPDDKPMVPKQAAEYLGVSVWSLLRMRQSNTGPRYERKSLKIIHYYQADLDRWRNREARVAENRYGDIEAVA